MTELEIRAELARYRSAVILMERASHEEYATSKMVTTPELRQFALARARETDNAEQEARDALVAKIMASIKPEVQEAG